MFLKASKRVSVWTTSRLIFAFIICWSKYFGLANDQKPEQVHLAIGETTSQLTVTWVTQNSTAASILEYGVKNVSDQRAHGKAFKFVDGGRGRRVFYIHRVRLQNLEPNYLYLYRCGDGVVWSDNFQFRVLPDHPFWSPRLAVFGDMGITGNLALPELIHEVRYFDSFDAILHVGDFAYNMDTDNGRYGDIFMRQIEPIASRVPYMTAVGNHELAYNFSHYKSRFSMPGGDGESLFYSFDIGPAHVIAFSSELYYYLYYGWRPVVRQYEWIKKDLEEANKPENREARPWIIAMAHRPMYCSNAVDALHCDTVDNIVRTGYPYSDGGTKSYLLGLEKLFYENGVDLIIGAHEHSYERFWPVYNRKVCNASQNNPYVNPPAPVHIVTGSAGSFEGKDPFSPIPHKWSAFRTQDYGFTRLDIYNGTHLRVEQISAELGSAGNILDSFTIISNKHGANLFTCHEDQLHSFQPLIKLRPAVRVQAKF
ncbi:hypothetical protein CRM22_009697 [Opisthorchis felineus]|uniref:Purple acid phosphatase n=1 Tax=Opisthorchis felineus TaxID=147828 RepID=A0A4S2L627_OPIFE|nr:hypothetical protein CRM22_009697 [Opisthorchis felineus]